jgi:hypothetical protein
VATPADRHPHLGSGGLGHGDRWGARDIILRAAPVAARSPGPAGTPACAGSPQTPPCAGPSPLTGPRGWTDLAVTTPEAIRDALSDEDPVEGDLSVTPDPAAPTVPHH